LKARERRQRADQDSQGVSVASRGPGPWPGAEGKAGRCQNQHAHEQARHRHVVAEEALRPLVQRVVAQSVELDKGLGGQRHAAQESRIQDPLPHLFALHGVGGQIEQGAEQQLLGALVGGEGVS
jgi:hypothetical protein